MVGFCAAVDNLSSLDPGVGKTSAIKHLVRQTLVSPHHHDVSFLLCLPRIAEIIRLAKELGLEEADYAVLTSDEKVNGLSSTAPSDARILLTTHEMVRRHVDGRSFNEASAFHFAGGVRTVRIWDEEFLPGEVVTVTQEELATLPAHLGRSQPRLRDAVDKFVEDMKAAANGDVLDFPALSSLYTGDSVDVQNSLGPNPGQIAIDALKSCMRLSGGKVRIARSSGRQITALGVRTTMPSDFYPLLVLDASGRVRQTYELLEKGPQIVRRLRTATKDYGNLTIRVMQRGGGKYSWQKHGQELAQEIASIISSKPEEPWLVIYHKSVLGGRFPEVVSEMASGDPARISFVNWGAHQGTNDYAHIPNVILAGTTFYEEHHYLGLAHLCAAIPTDIDPMPVLVDGVKAGEHSHHILQGLCRGSARRSIDGKCAPCTAYIIASKRSGIRQQLSDVFPGCRIMSWVQSHKKPKGKVATALEYIECFFNSDPRGILSFSQLMEHLQIKNRPNFNRTIRKHEDFVVGLSRLGVEEIASDGSRHKSALARIWLPEEE